jgi:hypothetical protein
MPDKRLTPEWQILLRETRGKSPDSHLRELVRYLARRAADEDFEEETLLARQRRKKLIESRHQPDDQ